MAVADIRIPPDHRAGLARLLALPAEKASELVAALKAEPPSLSLVTVARHVSVALATPFEEIKDTLMILAGMYLANQSNGSRGEELTDVVLAAAQELDEFRAVTIDWVHARAFLIELLGIQHSLGLTAKAAGVLYEYERAFNNARILTDIRPLFGERPEESPAAAVVVHTLRVTYETPHAAKSSSAFYLTLDANDLRQLQAQITRALAKEQSIVKSLSGTHLQVLSPEEEA